jgi:hypothetical protein
MKSNQAKDDETLSGPEMTYDRPSANEARRRRVGVKTGRNGPTINREL